MTARVVALANQKGGVAKTTTTLSLAAALAERGRRVLAVDLDPQAALTYSLGVDPDALVETVNDVLVRRLPIDKVTIAREVDLVPANIDLAGAEAILMAKTGREYALQRALRDVLDDYDFVLIDCPPSLGILTINALTMVQEVFLPLQPHFLALHGLSKLLRTIEIVSQRLNPPLRLTGVLLCMFDSGTRLAAEVTSDIAQYLEREKSPGCVWHDARMFATRIRRNIRLAEAPSFGQSIFQYAPSSHGAEDYRQLAAEVLAMRAQKAAA